MAKPKPLPPTTATVFLPQPNSRDLERLVALLLGETKTGGGDGR